MLCGVKVALCCVVLHRVALRGVMLCCIVLCSIVLYGNFWFSFAHQSSTHSRAGKQVAHNIIVVGLLVKLRS